jgi:hypothetical protein
MGDFSLPGFPKPPQHPYDSLLGVARGSTMCFLMRN